MAKHDELCPIPRGVGPTGCHCDLIAQVVEREQRRRYRRQERDMAAAISGAREQERERIAQAIEARAETVTAEEGRWQQSDFGIMVGLRTAAQIARNGGRDE